MSGLRKKGQDGGCDKAFLLHQLLLRQFLCEKSMQIWMREMFKDRKDTFHIHAASRSPSKCIIIMSQICRPTCTKEKLMHDPSCSRTLLDSAFENEAKCKSETEAAKREVLRLSDKFEQVGYLPQIAFPQLRKAAIFVVLKKCSKRGKIYGWKFCPVEIKT